MIKEEHKRFLDRYGSEDHANELIEDPDDYVRAELINRPNLSSDHIDKLMNDDSTYITRRMLEPRNKYITADHLRKAYKDYTYDKYQVIVHPNCPDDVIEKATQSPSFDVKHMAQKIKNQRLNNKSH
jgi:hypothetical protein